MREQIEVCVCLYIYIHVYIYIVYITKLGMINYREILLVLIKGTLNSSKGNIGL